jgi:hypothetical protein
MRRAIARRTLFLAAPPSYLIGEYSIGRRSQL